MLSVNGILDLLNDKGRTVPPFINKWRNVYYGMSLHIDGACPAFRDLRYPEHEAWIYPQNYFGAIYQQLFDVYLLNRHPRENEMTRQWRMSQYRPYTQAPFLQVIQVTTGAIFQDSNYSINISDRADNDYIWGCNFNGRNLVQYFSDHFQSICEDPNGIFVTIPAEPYYATTTHEVRPAIFFIPSKDILHLTADEVIFNLYDLTWAVNNVGYFRYAKDDMGRYIHVDDAMGGYYAHMMGRVPMLVAGGIWNTQGFYDSWLNAAKAIADDFVSAKSAEQMVNKEASHPFIIEASTDCPDCENSCGFVMMEDTREAEDSPMRWRRLRCETCGGSGTVSHNPADRMIVPPGEMGTSLVQIVSPDVAINNFHAANNAELYNAMMRALHLQYIDEAQSGVAKDRDLETRYQFLLRISNDLFDRLIEGTIKDILSLRNVSTTDGVTTPWPTSYTIVKPTQFQVKTATDLLEDYKRATDASIPDYMKARQLEDYVDKQFGGDELLKRKTTIIIRMDPLAVTTEGDKQSKVLGGAIARRQWQFNTYLPGLLDDIVARKGTEWFLTTSYESIKALVDEAFAQIPEAPMVAGAERSTVYER